MFLLVCMLTPVYDFFTASVTNKISKQLEVISYCRDSAAEFATQIANRGCARIFLKKDNLDIDGQNTKVFYKCEPDAQFQY